MMHCVAHMHIFFRYLLRDIHAFCQTACLIIHAAVKIYLRRQSQHVLHTLPGIFIAQVNDFLQRFFAHVGMQADILQAFKAIFFVQRQQLCFIKKIISVENPYRSFCCHVACMQAGKACTAALTASSKGERFVLFCFLLQAKLCLNLLPVTGNSAHWQHLCQSFTAFLSQLGSLQNIAQRIALSQISQRCFSVYRAVGRQIACLIFHIFFSIQLGSQPQLRTHPAPGCRLAQLQHLFYRFTGKICIQASCVHIAIAVADI